MNILYLDHSGFLVETTECYYLFDYYKGTLPSFKHDKPVIVFISHAHDDHFNPEVFSIVKSCGAGELFGVMGKDISPRKYPADVECIKASANQTYTLPWNTTLHTFLSTDEGVAFLLECPEGILYHAGDLNDWVWAGEPEQYNRQMTGSYRHEIGLLIDKLQGAAIDVAFLPLDPRQEDDYARGILYFLEKISVKTVYPMHYWGRPEVIGRFMKEYPQYNSITVDTETKK